MKPSQWMEDSIMCYDRDCICDGCKMQKIITSSKCKMKDTVEQLLVLYGKPRKTVTMKSIEEINKEIELTEEKLRQVIEDEPRVGKQNLLKRRLEEKIGWLKWVINEN